MPHGRVVAYGHPGSALEFAARANFPQDPSEQSGGAPNPPPQGLVLEPARQTLLAFSRHHDKANNADAGWA